MNKVYNFTTYPIENLLMQTGIYTDFLNWTKSVYTQYPISVRKSVHNIAKSILGPHDYTWQGTHRNWIWERSFSYPKDSENSRRWRLFASKRGFSLEYEVIDAQDPYDVDLCKEACLQFLNYWKTKQGDMK